MRKFVVPILMLIVSFYLFGEEIKTFPDLGKPDSINIDKDRIYITDQASILIYSLKNFKLIKKFGRAGEGPGEFKISNIDKIGLRVSIQEENILVNSMGKLSIFSLDGDFIKEKKVILNPETQIFKPLGKKYVGFYRKNQDNINYFLVSFFDPDTLQKEREIHRMKGFLTNNSIDPLRLALLLKNATMRGPIYNVYNDMLFVEGEDCQIFVYDNQGKAIGSFTLYDYEKLEITEDFKKKVMTYLEKRLPTAFAGVKRNGKFKKYFPLRSFLAKDERIFVQTFKGKKGQSEFYVFDFRGKLLHKVMIPFQESEFLLAYPFDIVKGKIYQLVENLDLEEWELHINRIIQK